MTPWKRFVRARTVVVSYLSAAACTESATAYAESAAASTLSAAASTERASAVADKVAAAAEMAAVATAMTAANAESSRAAVCAANVALSRVEDAHAKIFQATSESTMQPTSEKVAVGMEHLLPHEITERELEMQESNVYLNWLCLITKIAHFSKCAPPGPRSPRPPARSPSPPLDPARLPLLLSAPPPDQAGLPRPCPSPAGPLQQGPVPTSGAPSSPPPYHGRVAPNLLLAALGATPPDLPVALLDDQRCPCSLPSSTSSPPHGAAPGLPHHYHLQPRPASTLLLCSAPPPLLRPASAPPLPSSAPPLLRQGTPAISCSLLAFGVRTAASLLQAKADAGPCF
nr:splicing factor 3A subunit 2-like [Aegilops tauschii subsp. strangulata]